MYGATQVPQELRTELRSRRIRTHDSNFIFQLHTCGCSPYAKTPLTRGWVCRFTIAAGSRQRIPRDSWSHFTVSHSRLPQLGGPGPRIYIPQEQGGPVIPPSIGFSFCRLPRLAELRWKYWNPPPHGLCRITELSQIELTFRRPEYRSIPRTVLLFWFSIATKRIYWTVAYQWIIPCLFVAAGLCIWWAVG
jgi:hypothetical protein